jgi:hypothetical protein
MNSPAMKTATTYRDPVSDEIQVRFNELALARNLSGKEIYRFACFFFIKMRGSDQFEKCPFPNYLSDNYKKTRS